MQFVASAHIHHEEESVRLCRHLLQDAPFDVYGEIAGAQQDERLTIIGRSQPTGWRFESDSSAAYDEPAL